MGQEQEMVNQIRKHYGQYCQKQSSKNVQGKTCWCDLTLEIEGTTYFLEVKHSNENNTANYAKQMLTECIMNRKHHVNFAGEYGLLLDYDNRKENNILNYVKDNIQESDWIAFGECFECKKVFLFDSASKKLFYFNWNDLYSNYKVTFLPQPT